MTVPLAEAPAKARSGMTADVTITIASATNVLTVPAAALRGSEGDYRVLTMDATGSRSRPRPVGLVTSTTAEIKNGLTEGTAVVTGTAAPRPARPTTGRLRRPARCGGRRRRTSAGRQRRHGDD